jgi:hypothetical protein
VQNGARNVPDSKAVGQELLGIHEATIPGLENPQELEKNDNDHSFNKVFAGWNVSGIDDEHLKIVVLNLSVDMALPLSMAVSCHFPLIGRHPKKWKEKNRFPHHSQKVWMMQETPV